MAFAIKRTYEVALPATVSADTVRVLQDEMASSWGVIEATVVGDFADDGLIGLRVELTVETTDGREAGYVARRAIHDAVRSVGLRMRSFRVTSGSGREV